MTSADREEPREIVRMQAAIQRLHSAVDAEMGDRDDPNDESELMVAMQGAAEFCGDDAERRAALTAAREARPDEGPTRVDVADAILRYERTDGKPPILELEWAYGLADAILAKFAARASRAGGEPNKENHNNG